jgi:hypothetical protein
MDDSSFPSMEKTVTLPNIPWEVGAKMMVLPLIMNRTGSLGAFCNFIDAVDPVSAKAPSGPVVVERAGSLVRLTFTPAIPVVPPVFLTVPFNEIVSAPTENVQKRIVSSKTGIVRLIKPPFILPIAIVIKKVND